MMDWQPFDAAVAKFRKTSPNVAVALDELKKHVQALEPTTPAPAPPPTPLPAGLLKWDGSASVSKPTLIEGVSQPGTLVSFLPGSDGSIIRNSTLAGFNVFGASRITVENNTFTGGVDHCLIWDRPAGSAPKGLVIRGNRFSNFRSADAQAHTEALYVGYSTDGLIEGNTFTDNGNTSHVFFTWFGEKADPASSYPRNWTVSGNTFGPTAGAFFSVNLREEIPVSANIRISRGQPSVAGLVSNQAFLV